MFCKSTDFIFVGGNLTEALKLYNRLKEYSRSWHLLLNVLQYVQFAAWIAGLVIVYGWRRGAKKPCFVHVIWGLISATEILRILVMSLRYKISE